jgi:hypothetical protein
MIVPTLRVGMHPVTLRVTIRKWTRSVQNGIPTRSVGTIIALVYAFHGDLRMMSTKFIGLNFGSSSTSTSALTVPKVVSGL